MPTILVATFLLLLSVVLLQAKRGAPRHVEPVVVGGVRYSVSDEPDLAGVVIATDTHSGKELWSKRIYRVFINPAVEEDVQWVFITSLVLQDGMLLIVNERREHFELDPITRKVRRIERPGSH